MKLLLIQLSDIHFVSDTENALLARSTKLFDSIKNNVKHFDKTLLIVTGDIAFSGKEAEYKVADNFFTELLLELEEYSGKEISTIFLQGNHDCDFSVNKSLRDSILKNIHDKVDEEILGMCTSCQKQF